MSKLNLAIERYRTACDAYAHARAAETQLEDERHGAKHAALLRVIGTENPATGKPHSGSSASDVVTMEPGYADYLRNMRLAVMATIDARCEMEVARTLLSIAQYDLMPQVA